MERFLKYIDIFGKSCTFYNERMPKLYTINGGIFTILSILACVVIFIIFSLDDIKRKSPITTTISIPSDQHKKIDFEKEKIWIPWRIVDYNNNEFINHTGLLFPIIYYISKIKNSETKKINFKKKLLNYKLCNETSMVYESHFHKITIPLNEIYCIDIKEEELGGTSLSEYMNYIQFNIYYCENGTNFNENNSKCTSFDTIMNYIGNNNSLKIDFYYPIVQFQPTNKTNPVIIIYRQNFYHLNKYINKNERLYLQEFLLTDDSGWIFNNDHNSSYWGLNSIENEIYFNGDENIYNNEESNSKAYSFNLYLEPGIIYYKRYYKKLYTIFSDFFPIAYIIFIIMKNISKLFKKVESNKKMIDLLFEHLKEKPNFFEESLKKLKFKNNFVKYKRGSFNKLINKNQNDIDLFKNKKLSIDIHLNHKNFEHLGSSKNINKSINVNHNNGKMSKINLSSNKKKKKGLILNMSGQNLMIFDSFNRINDFSDKKPNNEKCEHSTPTSKKFTKTKLFPYKYYLFSVFIKNLDISKNNTIFSPRFSKIYNFLCQLFDITTYLSLQREFNALKKIISDKNVNQLEKAKRINVSSKNCIKDINYFNCDRKFHILA